MIDIQLDKILILDFGSQYTQLIARRVREAGVFSEIRPWNLTLRELKTFQPSGIILSGGPESVTDIHTAPKAPSVLFDNDVPVLGICYGMQTMAGQLGGEVRSSEIREFGYAEVFIECQSPLFGDIKDHHDAEGAACLDVWMSHGDQVCSMPDGFELLASTDSCPIAGMQNLEKNLFGIQFHPEVTHTLQGQNIFT